MACAAIFMRCALAFWKAAGYDIENKSLRYFAVYLLRDEPHLMRWARTAAAEMRPNNRDAVERRGRGWKKRVVRSV